MRDKEKGLLARVDNRGSTMVVVLVALAFVSMLTAVLLYMSYINIQMKKTDRESKENAYDAEAVLDEVRVGVQNIVSDAISTAYTDVLVNYTVAVNADTRFRGSFKTAFEAWGNGAGPLLIQNAAGGRICNASVLMGFISNPAGVTLTAGEESVTTDLISLKNIRVRYVKNGYATSVTTDIAINMPEFSYTLSDMILSAVPDYTLIADKTITQIGGASITVDGNAYAHDMVVSGTGRSLQIGTADNFIIKGNLDVSVGAAFSGSNNSSLWVNNITVGNDATANLTGDTYVANDLLLKGSGSKANLSGRYFGFGNSLTDPSASSAIIVNGAHTRLNLSSLNNLLLAGTSFINPKSFQNNPNGVLMGESLSVKSNQLAYIIPRSCMAEGHKSPEIYQTSSVPNAELLKTYVKRNAVLWGAKTLNDYIDDVQLVYYPLSGNAQTLVYYFMKFNTTARANAYFQDYFARNKDEMEEYLSLYADAIAVNQTAQRNTAGNVTSFNGTDANLLAASPSIPTSTTDKLKEMFNNLCVTLSTSKVTVPAGVDSVYKYIVNQTEVAKLANRETVFRDESGTVRAVIVKDGYTVGNSLSPDVKVVIATGDIDVTRNFVGLLISGGNITTSNSLTADRAGVTAAFQATATIGQKTMTLLDYLRVTAEVSGNQEINTGAVTWNMDELVTYQNWSKN